MTPDGISIISYWKRNKLVGTRRAYCCAFSTGTSRSSAYWPHTAYFCAGCGEIWGRLINDYQFDYSPTVDKPWIVVDKLCERHGIGVLFTNEELDSLSPELLATYFWDLVKKHEPFLPQGQP